MANDVEFGSLETDAVVEMEEKKEPKNPEVNARIAEFRNELEKTPELKEALYSHSKDLRVISSCAYGADGGLILASKGTPQKDADGKIIRDADGKVVYVEGKERRVETTPRIVGYIIENVGSQPIKYLSEIFKKNADGVYEGAVVDCVINPGEKKAISRKCLTMTTSSPEFSFQLENGRVIASSGTGRCKGDDAILSSYYFKPTDSEFSIHDDKYKVAIADAVELDADNKPVKWAVKPEYADVFGYLDNPKAAATRTKTAKSSIEGIALAAAAHYVNQKYVQKIK